MTGEELQAFRSLKKAHRDAGFILSRFPISRNVSNDGFVRIFKHIYPDRKYSLETITRARRFVQNTKKLFPKNGTPTSWENAIAELKKDNSIFQTDLFEDERF